MKSRALYLAALALLAGLSGWTGTGPAVAQQLDAGKPPAQIFAGTCAACHRSARGLVKSVSPGSLPSFLRQHYTTGNDMAGTMAAYVLGNGGTQQVAEPPPKREPKQKAKSDGPEIAAHTPEPKDLSKSAKQKAGKKGQPEPATGAKEQPARIEPEKSDAQRPEAAKPDTAKSEPPKSETAKLEQPAAEPPKSEAGAVDCKVDEPKRAAAADEGKPGFAMTSPNSTPPRQPAALLTLPGFPAPVAEPEPDAEPAAAAHAQPGCDPTAKTAAVAPHAEEPHVEPARTEQPKEQAKEPPKEQPPAISPPSVAEAPRSEPVRPAATEAAPTLDIMREEVHAPSPPRIGQQKKRAP